MRQLAILGLVIVGLIAGAWLAAHYAVVFSMKSAFATGVFSPVNQEYTSAQLSDPTKQAEIEERRLALQRRFLLYAVLCGCASAVMAALVSVPVVRGIRILRAGPRSF